MQEFTAQVTTLKDVVGQTYYGISVPVEVIKPYLETLQKIEPEHELYMRNQQERDGGKYHITIIPVMEVGQIMNKFGVEKAADGLEALTSLRVPITLKGIGTGENKGSKAYFIVVESTILNNYRNGLGLPDRDLHVTIGFNPKDVFGVSKKEVMWRVD